MHYNIEIKKKLCEIIYLNKASAIKTVQEYNVPLKTLEKWITAYNKNYNIFNSDYLSSKHQVDLLKKRKWILKNDFFISKKEKNSLQVLKFLSSLHSLNSICNALNNT